MPDQPMNGDGDAIAALIASQDAAWRAGDAAGFAAWVMDDCVFTNIFGMQIVGREGFEAQHARIFATLYRGTRLQQSISHLRFPAPDVAVVHTDCMVSGAARLPPGLAGADGALHTRLVQVLARRQGAWWISVFHNVPVSAPPSA